MAGVTVVAWYPITPSSSLCETLIDYLRKYRMDPETGKATFAVVQAEDEIAALGMVVGASWAGARSMTSTSGPGISLMSEFTGLAYYAEMPAVIFDVQRVGPSTGLPTRTAQGDIAFAAGSVARGHQAHPAPARLGQRVLHDEHRGVRSRRAIPDADLRDDRPRPRDEHVDVRAVPVSRGAARSRQGADPRDAPGHRRVGPLQGRRRRRHSVSHAAGAVRAVLLHARLRAQRQGAVQREAGRLHEQHRQVAAQVRDRARARAGARDRSAGRRAGRHHRLRHVALGRRREP